MIYAVANFRSSSEGMAEGGCGGIRQLANRHARADRIVALPHCLNTWKAEPQKEKCPFLFRRNLSRANQEKRGTFFFGVAE